MRDKDKARIHGGYRALLHDHEKQEDPENLEFKKYDPKARKHVAYKEIKLK